MTLPRPGARRLRAPWRRMWASAAAAALLLTLRGLRLHRSLDLGDGPLVLPSRWPACSRDSAGTALQHGTAVTQAPPFAGAGLRFAILSTWLPTRCGLATFSAGLRGGLLAGGAAAVDVLAVQLRSSGPQDYGPEVVLSIGQDEAADYTRAADHIVAQKYAAVFLQHEYGIFGGYRGEFVVDLVRRAAAVPFVVTLHTVESVPSPMVQHALTQLLSNAVAVTALSPSGCRAVDAWNTAVDMPTTKGLCHHVPHGVPQLPLCLKAPLKRALGVTGRFVLLCGGLLSPPKGLEVVLKALPDIAARVPNVLLIVAGQAHPVLGQNYLEQLQALSNTLGVARFVKFHSSFLQEADLLQLYQSADVFLCAHTSAEQTSSGTMLFAMTSGVAVVATPFAQAAELLTDGSGVLVPFNDAGALAEAAVSIARNSTRSALMRTQSHRSMSLRSWTSVASRYVDLISARHVAVPSSLRFAAVRPDERARLTTYNSIFAAEVSNGIVAVSVTRNQKWVDGVGPGWHPTDTFLSRYRSGWGVDSLLMTGCFISHELREPLFHPSQRYVVRTLEDLATTFKVDGAPSGASAWLQERWQGPVGESGNTAAIRQRVTVAADAAVVRLELEAKLTGNVQSGSDTWLTAGFDQLSSNPALRWESVAAARPLGARVAHKACSWDGASITENAATVFELHGSSLLTGETASLLVAVSPGHSAAMQVHFTCEAGHLHSVQFDSPLLSTADQPAAKRAYVSLDVTWSTGGVENVA